MCIILDKVSSSDFTIVVPLHLATPLSKSGKELLVLYYIYGYALVTTNHESFPLECFAVYGICIF